MTDLEDFREYSGSTAAGYSDGQVEGALASEVLAQAKACTVPDPVPADLREALMRRVVRNLAMRSIPLGVQADEMGGIRIGSNDPEIRRLEGPYRRRRVG